MQIIVGNYIGIQFQVSKMGRTADFNVLPKLKLLGQIGLPLNSLLNILDVVHDSCRTRGDRCRL